MLTADEQRTLFTLARRSIRAALDGTPQPELPDDRPVYEQILGVFVTLRHEDELRGCIGHAVGRLPLAEGVRTLALSAAFHDRRFDPVTMGEQSALDLELSILSELTPADVEQLEVGRHGLVVRSGEHSGLLLPQVAADRGWDAEGFLAATCRKAGLPDDAWQDEGTELLWFTCDVFAQPASATLPAG